MGEVQRVLDAESRTHGARPKRGRACARKSNAGMTLSDFEARVFGLGLNWLTLRQQRLLFDTIDVDRSGRITEGELLRVAKLRGQMELEREDAMSERLAVERPEASERVETADLHDGQEIAAVGQPSAPPCPAMSEYSLAHEHHGDATGSS